MGSRQRRLRGGDGLNMAEKPPDRVSLCDAGEREGRDRHPCRPALHAHLGHGRYLCAGAPRLGHRLSWRPDPLHPEHDLWFREYVLNYTNISTIIDDDYKGASELDGLFSGWMQKPMPTHSKHGSTEACPRHRH